MADDDLLVRAAIRDEMSAPLHQIRDALRQVGQEAEQTGRRSRTGGRGLDAMGASAAGMAKKAGGLAIGALGGVAVAAGTAGVAALALGVKTAAGMETAKIGFSTMLGSGKKADVFLKQLSAFAAKTPFEFPELQTAASSLVSAGINAKDVIPIMTTLGDVTSGMGTGAEGVQRATVAIQQMNAAGKISGEDLAQLRDAGIPVYDLLAKATGKSKAEVVGLANAGKLGQKELGQMMNALKSGAGLERFSGLMDKQSASLTGMWSTLKDTVTMGLAHMVEPALPSLKRGLGMVSAGFTSAFGWVANHQSTIGTFFRNAGETAKSFGKIAWAVIGGPFTSALGSVKGGVSGLVDFLNTHQADIVRFFLSAGNGALTAAQAVGMFGIAGVRGFAMVVDGIANFLTASNTAFGSFIDAAASAFFWIPGIGDKLLAAKASFASMTGTAAESMHKTATGARTAADVMQNNLNKSISDTRANLNKVGNTEIAKAALRDSATRAGIAIDGIGKKADGAQIHLKKFSDRTRLSAAEQAALTGRLNAARNGLQSQLGAMSAAGMGQKALTSAWKTGKARLYDEFVQMGLSKKEAGALAKKYAGVQPKVKTTVTQPGMPKAKSDADALKTKTGDIPGSHKTNVSQPGMAAAKTDAGTLKSRLDDIPTTVKTTVTTHYEITGQRGENGGPGDTLASKAHGRGSFGGTLAGHAAASRMSGAHTRITNAFTGGGGHGHGSGDHQAGRALDLVGSGLHRYRQAIRDLGGYAEFHGSGPNRHLHAVPAQGPRGDTRTSMARTSRPTSSSSGGYAGPAVVVAAGGIRIDAANMGGDELAAAVLNGIAAYTRDQAERK